MEKILIQFPTRERPEKFIKYLAQYIDLLENKEDFVVNVSCDILDPSMNTTKMRDKIHEFPNTILRFSMNNSKIEAVNAGVELLEWDIVILASDDMWPLVPGYDNIIRESFRRYFPSGDGVLHFNDGYQGSKLNTLIIMDRKYYNRFGYLYNPIYKSLYADNEFDEVSRILDKRVYIDQVIISHEHPGNVREIVSDDLHKHNHTFLEDDKVTYNERKRKRLNGIGVEKKIISFSLYGNDSKYILGAIENAKLQPKIYPGWKCRFYVHEDTVPKEIIKELFDLDCELIFKKINLGRNQFKFGLFWRYEVLMDKSIERCIVRDTDSRLSEREKICVDEWIKSGKAFHIMRDHRHHGSRIMGGMWGITENGIDKIHYKKVIETFRKHNKEARDQPFLAQMIYPIIKDDVCIHDDYHFFKDESPLKISHKKTNNNFIGEIIEI